MGFLRPLLEEIIFISDIQIEAVEWENISLTVIMYICNFVIAFKNNVQ